MFAQIKKASRCGQANRVFSENGNIRMVELKIRPRRAKAAGACRDL
jgi:hypothetical protein